jgi:hypothetical protein
MNNVLFYLIGAHFVADFPLQTEFLATGKNRHLNKKGSVSWFWCLFAHSMVHAFFVAVITQSWQLGVAELILHFVIDFGKCEGQFGVTEDQFLHLGCKYIWWAYYMAHLSHG